MGSLGLGCWYESSSSIEVSVSSTCKSQAAMLLCWLRVYRAVALQSGAASGPVPRPEASHWLQVVRIVCIMPGRYGVVALCFGTHREA